MRMRLVLVAMTLLAVVTNRASAGAIPYGNVGSYNSTTYSFTAASTEHIIAYIVGGFEAGDTNELGLLVNGTQQGVYGLNNHTSSFGDSIDFGVVNAGSTLVFILHNLSAEANAYSDPSMNADYDLSFDTLGHNHIYSTGYPGNTSPPVPIGTYVAFEDEPFPDSDFNYNDESFVFTNVAAESSAAPEPASLTMLGMGVASLFGYSWRRKVAESLSV